MVILVARGVAKDGTARETRLTASDRQWTYSSAARDELTRIVRAWFTESHPDVVGTVGVGVHHD